MPALEEWTDYGVGTLSRNGGLEGRQYQTRQDPTNFAEPFLALCLTQTGDQVMEVVAGLDQKHYVQGPETLFQRKALYSLRVFFPELTEADFLLLQIGEYDQLHVRAADQAPAGPVAGRRGGNHPGLPHHRRQCRRRERRPHNMTTPLSVFQHTPTGHVPRLSVPGGHGNRLGLSPHPTGLCPPPPGPLRGWAQAMGVKAVFVRTSRPGLA